MQDIHSHARIWRKEPYMRIAKWGNSLAVRLPAAVVEALDLKDGDDIELTVLDEKGARRDPEAQPRRAPQTSACLPRPASRRFQVRSGRGECPVLSSIRTSSSISLRPERRRRIERNASSAMAALSACRC